VGVNCEEAGERGDGILRLNEQPPLHHVEEKAARPTVARRTPP
jgi:hypothetical protein